MCTEKVKEELEVIGLSEIKIEVTLYTRHGFIESQCHVHIESHLYIYTSVQKATSPYLTMDQATV